MQTIIAYVDDADHAQSLMQGVAQAHPVQDTHWVLVACAPRITHRVSKFVSNRSRESWRNKWADRLFQACVPMLQAQGFTVSTLLAREPLPDVLAMLQTQYGMHAQVIDMRRPKEVQGATVGVGMRKFAGTLTGIGALWTVLVGDVLAA